jgi:periplasmic copper chaperone A
MSVRSADPKAFQLAAVPVSVRPNSVDRVMYKNMPSLRYFALIAAVVLIPGAGAVAQQFKANAITVDQPWTRATPPGAKVTAGYMTITNTGSEPDRLVGGVLPEGRFELHEMKMDGNVMQMREVKEGLEIKPGQKVELNPDGYHAMFVGLTKPIKKGEAFKGQLRFEKAGLVDIEYQVEDPGSPGPQHHHHH